MTLKTLLNGQVLATFDTNTKLEICWNELDEIKTLKLNGIKAGQNLSQELLNKSVLTIFATGWQSLSIVIKSE